MISEGHVNVDLYTLGQIWEESRIVIARLNQNLATETTLLHAAISTAVASFGTKNDARKAHKQFQDLIKDLNDG